MTELTNSKRRLAYAFSSLHLGFCLIAFLGHLKWTQLDVVGQLLAVVDFPASMVVMAFAWVLPEFIEIMVFIVLGTLWWFYLGGKADAWFARKRTL